LDWYFPIPENDDFDWNSVNLSLLCIPGFILENNFIKHYLGVAETGLFLDGAKAAYFATPEGEIQKVFKK
jgi:hypothetical protein